MRNPPNSTRYENLTTGTTNVAFVKHNAEQQTAKDILINEGGPGLPEERRSNSASMLSLRTFENALF